MLPHGGVVSSFFAFWGILWGCEGEGEGIGFSVDLRWAEGKKSSLRLLLKFDCS